MTLWAIKKAVCREKHLPGAFYTVALYHKVYHCHQYMAPANSIKAGQNQLAHVIASQHFYSTYYVPGIVLTAVNEFIDPSQ